MPDAELAPMQRELWRLVGLAQRRGTMTMTPPAVALWESLYTELSQEHSGLAGSIINRAEALTLRLALNRTAHLAERKRMMTRWADYLDGLRDSGGMEA